jgi:hypothetical protein
LTLTVTEVTPLGTTNVPEETKILDPLLLEADREASSPDVLVADDLEPDAAADPDDTTAAVTAMATVAARTGPTRTLFRRSFISASRQRPTTADRPARNPPAESLAQAIVAFHRGNPAFQRAQAIHLTLNEGVTTQLVDLISRTPTVLTSPLRHG